MDLHWRITDTAPTGGVCGWQQHPDDNVGVSHINTGNRRCKDSQFWPPMNQFHPPPGYSYLTAQPPFPGAPLFYHRAPFNMTPSSEPISGATQGYPSYRPSWQGYDSPQRCYGGHQKFPPQQFAGQGPSSPGAPRVPPAPPGNNAVILPTSSASTPYEQHPGAPARPPIALPTKQFQQTAELRSADFAGIQDLPQLPRISYDKFDEDYESDDSSDLGSAKCKAPISLKQMEFSLKQFAKRIGQPNFSTFNKWKKVWAAGFLEKKHGSIIPGWNRFKQRQDGPLN